MSNFMNHEIAIVTTQYVEDYSEDASRPYFKFKGGSHYMVRTAKEATAIGVVLSELHKKGFSAGEYPVSVMFFPTVEAAKESVAEWLRDDIIVLGDQTV